MKIIHTSDWHLGMPLGTDSYADCQRFFFTQLYELAEKEKVQAVIIAGDIFDSSVSNSEAIALYNEAVTHLCADMGSKVVIVAGNHDGAARLASCSRLLENSGLYITGRLERSPEPVMLDEKTAVYPLPFFGRDEAAALYPELADSIKTQEQAMNAVCDDIRGRMDKNCFNIVVSHCLAVDADISESDRSARIGMATAVSRDVFDGFDYAALGHIHKPQTVTDRVRYSGSPIKYSFGKEETQEKGVVLIDTDADSVTFVPLKPLYDRKTVEGTYDEICAMTDLDDTLLRLYVTDRCAGPDLLSEMRLRFPKLLELYGMSIDGEGTLTSLSSEELESMSDEDIMKKFMLESFGCEPTEEQTKLFLSMMEQEGDEQ